MHLTRVHRTQGIPPDQPSPPAKGALDPEGGTWDPPTWENVFFHFFAAIFLHPKWIFRPLFWWGPTPPPDLPLYQNLPGNVATWILRIMHLTVDQRRRPSNYAPQGNSFIVLSYLHNWLPRFFCPQNHRNFFPKNCF